MKERNEEGFTFYLEEVEEEEVVVLCLVRLGVWWECAKCNLSGRRVVVSISSTSDSSCLWKPGLMILWTMELHGGMEEDR